MVLGTAVDLSVLPYPVLVIMRGQGVDVGRGGASPQPSGEAEPAPGRRARRSQPQDVGRGGASPQPSGEAEPIFSPPGKKCSCVLVCSGASMFDGY